MTQVFVKGDASTPYRFWNYALVTEQEAIEPLKKEGYMFSLDDTNLFLSLSEEEKKKINFSRYNTKYKKNISK